MSDNEEIEEDLRMMYEDYLNSIPTSEEMATSLLGAFGLCMIMLAIGLVITYV